MNISDTNAFVTAYRTQATNLLTAYHKLLALNDKWTALDLGNTLNNADIGGENDGITKEHLSAVVGTTVPALTGLFAQGHTTNLHTIAII